MGEIMEVSEGSTNVTYKVDDRTGPWMEVKRWIDEQVRGGGGEGVCVGERKSGGRASGREGEG